VPDQGTENPQAAYPANSAGLEHSIKPAWSPTDDLGELRTICRA
jgi:hypothetical protein